MAEVELLIGGRTYAVACRDGGEDHLRGIAATVDARAADAKRAVGDVNEARQLLFAALLLADELNDAKAGGATAAAPVQSAEMTSVDPSPVLMHTVQQLEHLAEALEREAASA